MEKIYSVARAFISDNGYVLVADAGTHLFLPGGHVKYLEPVKKALRRELNEELGVTNIKIEDFIGLIENVWTNNNKIIHENTIIFKVSSEELTNDKNIISRETHLKFHWLKFGELVNSNFLPKGLLEFLHLYEKNKNSSFLSLINQEQLS